MSLIILPIAFLIIGLFPINDSYLLHSKTMYKMQKVFNFTLSGIAIFMHLLFWNYTKPHIVITIIYVSINFIALMIIYICAWRNYFKILKSRILSFGNYMQLTKGQIRNAILEEYNEFYGIDDIEKALKKIKITKN